mgnify:CR=1 FL=1
MSALQKENPRPLAKAKPKLRQNVLREKLKKQRQELAVGALPSDVRREIYRPRVLAYGALPWLPAATTREDLARRMLDDVADALRAVDEA